MKNKIKNIMQNLEDKWGERILIDHVFEEVSKQKITKAQTQEAIKKLEEEGYLFELKKGCYKRKKQVLDVEKEKYLSDLKFLFNSIKKDKNNIIVQLIPNPLEDIKKTVTTSLNRQFIKGFISDKEYEEIMGWIPDPFLQSARIDYKHEKKEF